ncbi:MAG: sigma-70 family RNA polymerase sigma factor [Eubacterium sp.]
MKDTIKINLKKYYSHYQKNVWIEVSEEVVIEMERMRNEDKAYRRKGNRYKAYFSFDCDQSIEKDVIFKILKPEDIYEQCTKDERMSNALKSLSIKQANRICLHTIFGMKIIEIAKAEKVDESSIRQSIRTGLELLREYLREN